MMPTLLILLSNGLARPKTTVRIFSGDMFNCRQTPLRFLLKYSFNTSFALNILIIDALKSYFDEPSQRNHPFRLNQPIQDTLHQIYLQVVSCRISNRVLEYRQIRQQPLQLLVHSKKLAVSLSFFDAILKIKTELVGPITQNQQRSNRKQNRNGSNPDFELSRPLSGSFLNLLSTVAILGNFKNLENEPENQENWFTKLN